MDEIKVNLENLTEEERKTLMALVDKGNKQKSVRYKPQIDERYWYVDAEGIVSSYGWENDNIDNEIFAFNNCFPTKEEAEAVAKKKRVLAKMEIFAKEHNEGEIDWDNINQPKYIISYSYHESILRISDMYYVFDFGSVYFTSKEVAQACIDELGDEIISAFVGD